MQQPLISVVIPTYNHAHFLGLAIQSVIQQSYTNWEMIIVDNHSTDNTEQVIAGFPDPRIRHLKIHNHGIIGASRNKGINEARGVWVAFLDSDDTWYPAKLQRSMEALASQPTLNVISTDELMVNRVNGKETVLHHGPYEEPFYQTLLVSGNRLSTSATLVRRDFLEQHAIRFREKKEFVTAEDYDFWMLLAYHGALFAFVPSVEGEYIIHVNNQSGQIDRHFRSVKAVLKDHVFNIQQFTPNRERLFNIVCTRFEVNSAINFLRQGDIAIGIKRVGSAFLQHPLATLMYFGRKITRTKAFR